MTFQGYATFTTEPVLFTLRVENAWMRHHWRKIGHK